MRESDSVCFCLRERDISGLTTEFENMLFPLCQLEIENQGKCSDLRSKTSPLTVAAILFAYFLKSLTLSRD